MERSDYFTPLILFSKMNLPEFLKCEIPNSLACTHSQAYLSVCAKLGINVAKDKLCIGLAAESFFLCYVTDAMNNPLLLPYTVVQDHVACYISASQTCDCFKTRLVFVCIDVVEL